MKKIVYYISYAFGFLLGKAIKTARTEKFCKCDAGGDFSAPDVCKICHKPAEWLESTELTSTRPVDTTTE